MSLCRKQRTSVRTPSVSESASIWTYSQISSLLFVIWPCWAFQFGNWLLVTFDQILARIAESKEREEQSSTIQVSFALCLSSASVSRCFDHIQYPLFRYSRFGCFWLSAFCVIFSVQHTLQVTIELRHAVCYLHWIRFSCFNVITRGYLWFLQAWTRRRNRICIRQ